MALEEVTNRAVGGRADVARQGAPGRAGPGTIMQGIVEVRPDILEQAHEDLCLSYGLIERQLLVMNRKGALHLIAKFLPMKVPQVVVQGKGALTPPLVKECPVRINTR